jgi:transcriptional regulator GlxA family with amidase domain
MCAYRSVLRREVPVRTSPLELPAVGNQQVDKPSVELEGHSTTPNILDARLRRLLELIETNPLSTIQDWALAFNLSNSHLQRLFKQATGVGLGRALTEKRLLRAAYLLLHTNMSVKEVAHAVGYEHTSSFTRAFERHFESGPRHYRRRNAA